MNGLVSVGRVNSGIILIIVIVKYKSINIKMVVVVKGEILIFFF